MSNKRSTYSKPTRALALVLSILVASSVVTVILTLLFEILVK